MTVPRLILSIAVLNLIFLGSEIAMNVLRVFFG